MLDKAPNGKVSDLLNALDKALSRPARSIPRRRAAPDRLWTAVTL